MGLSTIPGNLRHGVRSLARSPGFTTAVLLTLSLGIGVNSAIFSMVNAVLLRPLPFRDPGELVWIHFTTQENDRYPFSVLDFLDMRRDSVTAEEMAAVAAWSANLTGAGEPERLQGARASGHLFAMLGAAPEIGRTLREDDDRTAAKVAVLTYGLWQRRFGSDPGVVGRGLTLNGEPYTIVGVLPRRFPFPYVRAELVVPLAPEFDPGRHERRSVSFLRVAARLKQGTTLRQAQEETTAIATRLRKEFPQSNGGKIGTLVLPYRDEVIQNVRGPSGSSSEPWPRSS